MAGWWGWTRQGPALGTLGLRQARERFRRFSYDELLARDKASLDLFWLRDDSLDNLADLPPPAVLQQEIIEHLEAALAAFREVAASLPVAADAVRAQTTE